MIDYSINITNLSALEECRFTTTYRLRPIRRRLVHRPFIARQGTGIAYLPQKGDLKHL